MAHIDDQIIAMLKAHELKDEERFTAIEEKLDTLATKEDLEPILEAWNAVRNGRNGIMWVASTFAAVGAAILVIKGMFK